MALWKIAAPLGAVGVVALLFSAMPGSPSAGEGAANPAAVGIDNFNFTPPTLVVTPGTTVIWTNADDSPHTVREKDGKFKSGALDNEFVFGWSYCPETKDSGLVGDSRLLDFVCKLQLNLCARNRGTCLVRNSSSDG